MPSLYSENPAGFDSIKANFITDFTDIEKIIFQSDLCVFYDACSFRYHSTLSNSIKKYFSDYISSKNGVIIITKCIIMELGGTNKELHANTINYFKFMLSQGLKIILLEEDNIFCLLESEYKPTRVNDILKYAVRAFNSKQSTIKQTIDLKAELKDILSDRQISTNSLCTKFFTEVRKNKEEDDNLGEELIGICIYMLLHLTGEENLKFTIFTDDKSAALRINEKLKSIPNHITTKKTVIISTPRLTQLLINETLLTSITDTESILSSCKIEQKYILGLKKNDLDKDEYKHTANEWAKLLLQPNEVRIIF
ncbi:MAG: hypothetical protein II973_06225 [Spirochaetaceae bacterium]|nr:hypothetical protein [Spirochaetaceae bacterium]